MFSASAPIRCAAFFVLFIGLYCSVMLLLIALGWGTDAARLLRLLPLPAAAVGTLVFLHLAGKHPNRKRTFLWLAAVSSLFPAGAFAAVIAYMLPPGVGVFALFPAVVFLEEAHLGPARERRRREAYRRRYGELSQWVEV